MKILEPGHVYELDRFDKNYETDSGILTFVKRQGRGYPGNVGHHSGTNLQEVLRAMIDRVQYLNKQIPDDRNDSVITDLRHALWLLEARAAERHKRQLNASWYEIEKLSTCKKCGHIGCLGECHP